MRDRAARAAGSAGLTWPRQKRSTPVPTAVVTAPVALPSRPVWTLTTACRCSVLTASVASHPAKMACKIRMSPMWTAAARVVPHVLRAPYVLLPVIARRPSARTVPALPPHAETASSTVRPRSATVVVKPSPAMPTAPPAPVAMAPSTPPPERPATAAVHPRPAIPIALRPRVATASSICSPAKSVTTVVSRLPATRIVRPPGAATLS